MSTITIELDDKRLAELRARAEAEGVRVEQFAQEVLEAYAEDSAEDNVTPEQRAAIEAGLRDIEEGRAIPHDEVFAKLGAKFGW